MGVALRHGWLLGGFRRDGLCACVWFGKRAAYTHMLESRGMMHQPSPRDGENWAGEQGSSIGGGGPEGWGWCRGRGSKLEETRGRGTGMAGGVGEGKEERQADTAPPSCKVSPASPHLLWLLPVSRTWASNRPSPHGLSHSQHLSFPVSGWHLLPCPHSANPPSLDPLEPPAAPTPGAGSVACHRVKMVPARPELAGGARLMDVHNVSLASLCFARESVPLMDI